MAGMCGRTRARIKVVLMVFFLAVLLYVAIYSAQISHMTMAPAVTGRLMNWTVLDAVHQGQLSPLTRVRGSPAYVLSAIATWRTLSSDRYDVVAHLFDGQTGGSGYACCLLLNVTADVTGDVTSDVTFSQLHVTRATLLRQFHHIQLLPRVTEYFYPAPYPAKQFLCPASTLVQPAYLSLTPLICSHSLADYVPVLYPEQAPGQLAVCAKVAYKDSLSPDWLIEWFEMQRLLGVDKVAVYIMSDLPSPVYNVFRHYEQQGLALLVPFGITEEPKRSFRYGNRSLPQFRHDEQLPIFDCMERLSGYSYVAGIDTDELIVPARNQTLKQLLEMELLPAHPDAAGFYFYQQYHILEWGRGDNSGTTKLTVQNYQQATPPRWESQKYIYLPSRVNNARTHEFYGRSKYTTYTVDPEVATIHHYRVCPKSWPDCLTMKRVTAPVLSRYKTALEAAVISARKRAVMR